MSTMFWVIIAVVVLVVVAVIYLVTIGRKTLEKIADSCVEAHNTEAFIKAVGGQWAYDRLDFIFPETLVELIREYTEMCEKRQRVYDEYDRRERQLYAEWLEKNRQIPEVDGSPETELLRRSAQDVANRAYDAVQDERRQWEYWSRNRTPVDVLIRRARDKERNRVVKEGICVWLERETTADSGKVHRRILRLPDGRYYLVGFELPVNNICYCTNSPGQFSKDELKAIIADKGRLAAAQCGVFDG